MNNRNSEDVNSHSKHNPIQDQIQYLDESQADFNQDDFNADQNEGNEDPDEQLNENLEKYMNEKGKKHLPQPFYKARKALFSLVNGYFEAMRSDYLENKGQVRFYFEELKEVKKALNQVVKLHPNKQEADPLTSSLLSMNPLIKEIEKAQENGNASKAVSKQKPLKKNAVFSYLPETQKLFCCPGNGKQSRTYKLKEFASTQIIDQFPHTATPIPFNDFKDIYFLDAVILDEEKGLFPTDKCNFHISLSEKKISKIEKKPILQRKKCGIASDSQYIYLIQGKVGQGIHTFDSEKFDPVKQTFQLLPRMNKGHSCPSVCVLEGKLWVFSNRFIQMLDLNENSYWTLINAPYNSEIYAFQYSFPININEILIFGGVLNNKKQQIIQVFSTKTQKMYNKGNFLPQPICTQRNSQPIIIDGYIYALGSVQSSIYAQLTSLTNVIQVVRLNQDFCFLEDVVIV